MRRKRNHQALIELIKVIVFHQDAIMTHRPNTVTFSLDTVGAVSTPKSCRNLKQTAQRSHENSALFMNVALLEVKGGKIRYGATQ